MADVNAKLGGAVTFEYLALPPGFNGRGGVVKTYMVIRGIQFTEAPKVNFPIDAKAKQGLIDAGKSKLGALPVVTIGDKHFAGHLPILRYLEAKVCAQDILTLLLPSCEQFCPCHCLKRLVHHGLPSRPSTS